MSCILFRLVVCLVRASVWYVYSFFWHAPLNTFSFSLSHRQKQFSLDLLFFSAYVSYLCSREDPYNTCGLHQAIKDISTSYDALVDLFESFESFLRRLDIYTKIPPTTAITEIIVKILIELLCTISLAVQQAKQGRLSEPHPLRYDSYNLY